MSRSYLGTPWRQLGGEGNAITYLPRFVLEPDAALLEAQEQLETHRRTMSLYGRRVRVPREDMWYGDRAYRFSGHTFAARPMPPLLASLAVAVEAFLPAVCVFGCVVNVYRDGRDSVSWHSDDDHGIEEVVIVSVSLGAVRRFVLRRKVKTATVASAVLPNRLSVDLEHGSALIMGAGVQETWEHALPKVKNSGLRINLTFRGYLSHTQAVSA